MRFPFRLGADLARARLFSIPPIHRFSPLVTHVSAADRFDPNSPELEWHSPEESVRMASQVRSPILWLGGTEPLLHPEIGRLTTVLAQTRRHVFVHTSGLSLRKRIHEFQPSSRLYFAVEFAGRKAAQDACHCQPGAFERCIESIRTAKLSGFHVCAHVSVTPATDIYDVGELIDFLDAKDVEGFIVSSGWGTITPEIAEKVSEIRDLIRSKPWERFSLLLQRAHEQAPETRPRAELPGAAAAVSAEGA